MCKFKALGVSWPPQGWEQLGHIQKSNGQAIVKDAASAMVTGLSYNIEPLPVYQKNNERIFVYAMQIDGWEYNIHNESREYPILSFMLQERLNRSAPKNLYISDIKTNSRPVYVTERSAHRVMIATLFIIKQINSGQVPDVERILRLYKIHPSQRSLYEINNDGPDIVAGCAPFICLEDHESESA